MTAPTIDAAAPAAGSPAPVATEPPKPSLRDLASHPELLGLKPETPAEESPPLVEGEEPAPEGEPPPTTFKVSVPLPGEGSRAGTLDIEFPTQEAADTVRHHLKQAAAVPRLRERLQQAQGDSAAVEFIEQKPFEGMLWIAQQKPEAAAQFLDTWLRSNHAEAAQALMALGYRVEMDQTTERALAAESQLAKERALRAVQDGRGSFQASLTQQQFVATCQDAVDDLVGTMGLAKDSEDYEIFQERASKRLAKLYQEKGVSATLADMQQSLQPLVESLTRPPHPSAAQARVPAGQPAGGQFTKEQLAAREQRAEQLRRLKGGGDASLGAIVNKLKPGASLYDLGKQR